jgi:alanine dehydrogenase
MDTRPADLTIGFPGESGTERRTILTPAVARALIAAGSGVIAEPGIGGGVFFDDGAYAAVGVRFAGVEQVWSAPLVLRYSHPTPTTWDA